MARTNVWILRSRMVTQSHEIAVEIGGMPILLRTQDASFRELLASRYAGFVGSSSHPRFEFDVDLVPPSAEMESDEDVHVEMQEGEWRDRKSTRLNSSHLVISYAVFCLKKKNRTKGPRQLACGQIE